MKINSKTIAYMGILTAILVVLQTLASYGLLKINVSLSFSFIPVMLGIAFFGTWAGLFLGFVFSTVVLICGLTGGDAFTNILIQYKPFETVLVIYLKGCFACFVAGVVYKALNKNHSKLAIWISSALCPMINTAIFCLFCIFVYKDFLTSLFDNDNIIYVTLITLAGWNFVIELGINLFFAPIVYRVNNLVKKDF